MRRPIPLIVLLLTIIFLRTMDAAEPDTDPFSSVVVPADASAEVLLEIAAGPLSRTIPRIADAELRIEHVREGLAATHYRYNQWIGQHRVYGGELILSVSRDGRIVSHHHSLALLREKGSWRADLLEELFRRVPELRSARVVDRSRAYRNDRGIARAVESLLVEDAPFRFTGWEVDSTTGEVLAKTSLYASAAGRIFPANPVTTLNDSSLTDGGDSAAAVPAAAYLDVELLDLAAHGTLEGPRVKIVDIDSPFSSRPTIEAGLLFNREQDEFEEVNAYHHLDRSQIYLQSLGYTGSRQIVPEGVRVDAHANRGADNSFFTSTSAGPTLLFGDGGVDDAEDPDIILHEYGHAIHDSLSPAVLFGGFDSEGRAISEGFGDYWAFSSGFDASRESGRDPYCIGDWDARCDGPGCAYPTFADCLRRVDRELTLDDFVFSTASGTEHKNGRIWSTFLRESFEALVALHGYENGRKVMDTLVLEGLQGLPSQPGFEHVVAKMITADAILFAADHIRTICTAARSRKLPIPTSCRPAMRGDTLVLPGVNGFVIPAGGGRLERRVVLASEATIRKVIVSLDFAAEAPADLEIYLTAPDGTVVQLKRSGTTLPRSVKIGRDRLPAELLETVEGRSNPGAWTLTLLSSGSSVLVEDWQLLFELQGAAKVESREHAVGSRMLPAVAHTPGAAGTFYVTDLAIANPGGETDLTLIYTPSGHDGASSYSAVVVAVPGDTSVLLGDLVGSLFDAEGSGSLEIRGLTAHMRVSSRTYNRAPSGSFGQTIPLVENAVGTGGRLVMTQVRRNLEFRTNVGLTETKGKRTEATLTLRSPDGSRLGMTTVSLEPFTHRQIPVGELASVAELDSGWIELVVTAGGGTISGYTSVVDNRTGDSVFAPALPVTSIPRPLVVPAVANAPGAHSTRWRSDLWIVNGTGVGETARLKFFHSDGTVSERVIVVDAGSSRLLPDVVRELFGTEGTGWIRIDDSMLTVTSRTWNDDPTGSFGQFIGAAAPAETVVEGETVIVPAAVNDDDFRTNVGITEGSGDGPALVQIEVMDRSGLLACSAMVALGPLQHRQMSLGQLGCGTLDGGRIEVSHLDGAGRIVAYASIVDQKTGDPSYVRAE